MVRLSAKNGTGCSSAHIWSRRGLQASLRPSSCLLSQSGVQGGASANGISSLIVRSYHVTILNDPALHSPASTAFLHGRSSSKSPYSLDACTEFQTTDLSLMSLRQVVVSKIDSPQPSSRRTLLDSVRSQFCPPSTHPPLRHDCKPSPDDSRNR